MERNFLADFPGLAGRTYLNSAVDSLFMDASPRARPLAAPRWESTERLPNGLHVYRAPRSLLRLSRHVERFLLDAGNGFREAFDHLAKGHTESEQQRLARFGYALMPSKDGTILGTNVLHGDPLHGEYAIYVNPFIPFRIESSTTWYNYGDVQIATPKEAAERIAQTMLHELAHVRLLAEGAELWKVMDELRDAIPVEDRIAAINAIAATLAGTGGTRDDFSAQYRRARADYFAAVRRAGGYVDLGGISGSP